jgi:hypothetical protein
MKGMFCVHDRWPFCSTDRGVVQMLVCGKPQSDCWQQESLLLVFQLLIMGGGTHVSANTWTQPDQAFSFVN